MSDSGMKCECCGKSVGDGHYFCSMCRENFINFIDQLRVRFQEYQDQRIINRIKTGDGI